MTSGIYLLTFENDDQDETLYYVGKSVDVEKRWQQHYDKFVNGTAAKSMQQAYNEYGIPQAQIIKCCHPDHLDVLEPIYIESYLNDYGSSCLNTSVPTVYSRPTRENIDYINDDDSQHFWEDSTLQHITTIFEQYCQIRNLEESSASLLDVISCLEIEKAEQERDYKFQLDNFDLGAEGNRYKQKSIQQASTIRELQAELYNEKNKSWWKKLWE